MRVIPPRRETRHLRAEVLRLGLGGRRGVARVRDGSAVQGVEERVGVPRVNVDRETNRF